MALTPDDIVNKTFETTRFRDGYDQEEVDNFLDEVVGEYRRLLEENETLKARVAELEAGAPAASAPAETPVEAPAAVVEAPAEPEPAPVQEQAAPETQEAAAPAEAIAVPSASGSADSLLQLAQRVHDEHVAEGEQRKAALIAEGETLKSEIEREGEERKAALEADFEAQTLTLQKRKAELESKIDELKTFERDYRLKLRGYIESQLRDLDRSSSLAFGSSSAPSSSQ